MSFADKLNHQIVEKKVSRAMLAAAIQVSPKTLYNWTRGVCVPTDPKYRRRLENFFNMPTGFFDDANYSGQDEISSKMPTEALAKIVACLQDNSTPPEVRDTIMETVRKEYMCGHEAALQKHCPVHRGKK